MDEPLGDDISFLVRKPSAGPPTLTVPPNWGEVCDRMNKQYDGRVITSLHEIVGPLTFSYISKYRYACIGLESADRALTLADREYYVNRMPDFVATPLALGFLRNFSVQRLTLRTLPTENVRYPLGMILAPIAPQTALPARETDGNMHQLRLERVSVSAAFIDNLARFRNLGELHLENTMMSASATIEALPMLRTLDLSVFRTESNVRLTVDVATMPFLRALRVDMRGRFLRKNTAGVVSQLRPFEMTTNSLEMIHIVNTDTHSLDRWSFYVNHDDAADLGRFCAFSRAQRVFVSIEAREIDDTTYVENPHDICLTDIPKEVGARARATFAERISARTIVPEHVLVDLWTSILKMLPAVVTLGPLTPLILGLMDPCKPLGGMPPEPMKERPAILGPERTMKARKTLLTKCGEFRQPVLVLFVTELEKASLAAWEKTIPTGMIATEYLAQPPKKLEDVERLKLESHRDQKISASEAWEPKKFSERFTLMYSDLPQLERQKWVPEGKQYVYIILNSNFAVDYPVPSKTK